MIDLKSNVKTILVSLDSLLDTRLGTLLKVSPEFAFNITNSENYYKREQDLFEDEKFGLLSKDNYSKLNDSFKEEILKNSFKTKIYSFLFELCNSLIMKAISTPHACGAQIVINIYPYELNNLEVATLVRAVSLSLNEQFEVTAVNISNENLTCEHVKENYSALIMYSYGDWLNLHSRKMQTKILKEVVLYAPKINFVRPLNEDEIKLFQDNNSDPYELTSMLICEFINLQFLPIKVFCADTPLNN